MPDAALELLNHGLDIAQGIIAEASILLLLVGLVIFLAGAFFLLAPTYVRLAGYSTSGKVIGAIRDTCQDRDRKKRNGREITVTRSTHYAVFEYCRPDGSLHQEKASEGGSKVFSYRTGQSVQLLVLPHAEYDDVYDADQKGTYTAGGIMLITGLFLMERAASLYASLGVGTATLVLILTLLILKMTGRQKPARPRPQRKRHHKHIEPGSIRPIEEFARKADR